MSRRRRERAAGAKWQRGREKSGKTAGGERKLRNIKPRQNHAETKPAAKNGAEIKETKMKEAERRGAERKQSGGRKTGSAFQAAFCGMMIALAFLLSYVETLIPINLGIPGVKLGLANLVTIVGLYTIGLGELVFISLVRIILVGFTFGNGFSTVYGMAGWALSLILMLLVKRTGWFGQTGVSITGGVGHNVGQLLIAALVVQNAAVFYYLPFLLAAGSAAGAVIGLLGGMVAERIQGLMRRL